jgi:hypothetical protein
MMSINKTIRGTGRFVRIAPICVAIAALTSVAAGNNGTNASTLASTNASTLAAQGQPKNPSANETNLPTMEVAHAVMVTVDLDFGKPIPTIADALREIDRSYRPDDGQGRTFAILDAYGGPTADGKLHISMHVSTEKPGIGAIVFRRTGEVLWKNRIVPAVHPPTSSFAGKSLLIMLDDEHGKPQMLDGSKGVTSVLDAVVRDTGQPVRDFWPDGEEREVTFFYSACGCPVKLMARHLGDATERTSDLPVIFPDDPAVAATISRLMGWP